MYVMGEDRIVRYGRKKGKGSETNANDDQFLLNCYNRLFVGAFSVLASFPNQTPFQCDCQRIIYMAPILSPTKIDWHLINNVVPTIGCWLVLVVQYTSQTVINSLQQLLIFTLDRYFTSNVHIVGPSTNLASSFQAYSEFKAKWNERPLDSRTT